MLKKILFPLDFSVHSNTLVGCIPFLKKAGMEELLLVHVIDPTEAAQWANVEEAIATRKKEAGKKMAKALSEILPPHEGIRGRYRIEVGLPHREILRIASEERVNLIIMGSHGHSFLEGALLGSVTHNVIRQTTIPVLIAKITFQEINGEKRPVCMGMDNVFRKILYPTDFSECSLLVLNMIECLKTAGIEEVIVAHIQDTRKLFPHLKSKMEEFNRIDSERLDKIADTIEIMGFKAKTKLKEGVPFVEINRIAEEENVSMIMLGSQGKSAVKEALMGSVSEAVARKNDRPVMIIPTSWDGNT